MRDGMNDSLSFEENADVERANDVLDMVNKKNGYILRGLTCGFDEDTGDVLFFLPAEDFLHISKERKEAFFDALKKAWQDAKFKVLHKEKIDGDVYFHVGFCSYFFRLKSVL